MGRPPRARLLCGVVALALAASLGPGRPATAAADPEPDEPVTYASRVVLHGPSASRVRLGAKQVTVAGRVTDAAGRPEVTLPRTVTLRFARGHRASLATTPTRRDGRFRITVPTWWHYAGRIVATVAPTTHEVDGESGPVVLRVAGARSGGRAMRVRTGYRPQGSPRWSRLTSLRWDPCGGAVTYRINPARAPRRARWHVRQAFRRISRATGLRFRYQGPSRKVPLVTRRVWPDYDPRADITIAWADRSMFHTFRGGVLGVGGSSGDDRTGYTKGLVELNSGWNRRIGRGFRHGFTLGSLLLHEIAHAVGLGHASDRRLVMNPSLGSFSWARYGRGDLIGLRRLGRTQGCWTPPSGHGAPAGRRADTPLWVP